MSTHVRSSMYYVFGFKIKEWYNLFRPCFCDERGVVRQKKDVLVFSRKRDNLTTVYPCFCCKMG